jgi:hypothetical protein
MPPWEIVSGQTSASNGIAQNATARLRIVVIRSILCTLTSRDYSFCSVITLVNRLKSLNLSHLIDCLIDDKGIVSFRTISKPFFEKLKFMALADRCAGVVWI